MNIKELRTKRWACKKHGEHDATMFFTFEDVATTSSVHCLHCVRELYEREVGQMEIVGDKVHIPLEDYYEYTDGTTSLDKETGNDTD